ncbi:MAG: GNAT family N-acetyltransferase [Proteobacteria bacterium]|nr:GNAT family N-acetyltransferase [Pseudomonadota bacterium]
MAPDQAGSFTLRDACADDAVAVQAIYATHVLTGLASFEEVPPDAGEMARRMAVIQAKGLPYIVAERDGRIGGYAYASPFRERSAYRYTVEDSVYVANDALRRGLGRSLLNAVITRCTAAGFRQMIAVIGDSENQGSIGLHRHLGFEMIGTMPAVGYKFGRWVDSVRMQRALGPGAETPPGAAGHERN